MGIYLEQDGLGNALPSRGKAKLLIAAGASVQATPHYVHDKSVCVVDNRNFDAAAFAFDEREFDAFLHDGTTRHKVWLEITPEQRATINDKLVKDYRGEPVVRGRTR